jgi:DNA-directed RNA polymerase specialized sigma24 family protein
MPATRAPKKQAATPPPNPSAVMAGVLAVLVAEREERLNAADEKNKPAKTEVLLANAGLTPGEIAQVMGKNVAAVQRAIQRGRK